jgi:hypothetical protein
VSDTAADLDRFYLAPVTARIISNQGQRLDAYRGKIAFPVRGVYFFRESG